MNNQKQDGALAPSTPMPSKAAMKRARRSKRKLVGYDASIPEMCMHCVHYRHGFYHKPTKELFRSICSRHNFQVHKFARCAGWSFRDDGGKR